MAFHSVSTTTIETSSSSESSILIRQKSDLVHQYTLDLGTVFRHSNAVGPGLFDFTRQVSQLSRVALMYLLLGCNMVALQTFLVTKDLAVRSNLAFSRVVWSAWDSKQGRQLRRKIEFEFFVLILGCGNGIALILLWPGWMLVGLAYLIYLGWTWAG